VIIEHGQWMTASGGGGEVSLEIHLPKLIGPISLEADVGVRRDGVETEAIVTAKYRCDCAWAGNVSPLELDQAGVELSTSPRGVLVAQSEHLSFDIASSATGGGSWSAALVAETRVALGPEASKPFVTSLTTDLEPLAELTDVGALVLGEPDEF
jgi:hypothetical protein